MKERTTTTVRVKTSGKAAVKVIVTQERKDRQQRRSRWANKLRFGKGNAKLDGAIFTFSLPAGHSCPFARACLSKADRITGLITDGPDTEFRCYAVPTEARATNVRDARWHNFELLRRSSLSEMVDIILASLTPYAGYVRLHDSGDFFSQLYFDAWCRVAQERPRTLFYAYTKSLAYWVKRKDAIPANLVLTASYGGRHDTLIEQHNLRHAVVVFSEAEASELGLEIDHNDSHAMDPNCQAFALLLHGSQPRGSRAAEALKALKCSGEWGYGPYADEQRLKKRLGLPLVS